MDWPKFFTGILYSLLPRSLWGKWRYSSPTEFSRSTLVSGLIECTLSCYFLVTHYFEFLFDRARQLHIVGNAGTQLYMTGVLTVEYLFHPFSIILVIFSIEGFLRATAAFIQDESVPSLPFKLLELCQRWIHRRIEAKRREPSLPDHVEQISEPVHEIRISSSHAKDEWREGLTVDIRGDFYDIYEILPAIAPYRVLYVLRRKPLGTAIRGPYPHAL
jgi:hypothetical protein